MIVLGQGAMTTQGHMTIGERYGCLRGMKKRYRYTNREGRGRLLDEMHAVTGLNHKSFICLINGSPLKGGSKPGQHHLLIGRLHSGNIFIWLDTKGF